MTPCTTGTGARDCFVLLVAISLARVHCRDAAPLVAQMRACNATHATAMAFSRNAARHPHYEFSGMPGWYRDHWFAFDAKVLLVRLGKTGGGTLRSLFSTMNISLDMIHLHPTPLEAWVSHPLVLASVRDPVARFISSFNFWRFEAEAKGTALPTLLRCFNNSNQLIESVALASSSAASSASSLCLRHAHFLFQAVAGGDAQWRSIYPIDHLAKAGDSRAGVDIIEHEGMSLAGHLIQGICFYLGGMIEHVQESPNGKSTFIIASETYEQDIAAALAWLESRGVAIPPGSFSLARVHETNHDASATSISDLARGFLERQLTTEYRMLNLLMRRSVNKKAWAYCMRVARVEGIRTVQHSIGSQTETHATCLQEWFS